MKVDTWTSGLGASALFPVLTVLYVWKYDFHLWQRSVGVCQNSPRRQAFLPPKMTHPGFKLKTWKACHLPGPRAKRGMEELTSLSLPTSHSAQHRSPLQPQVTFFLGVQRHRLALGTALPAVTDFCAVVSPLFPWRASQTSSHLGICGALGTGWEWQCEGLKGAELFPISFSTPAFPCLSGSRERG